MIFKIIKRIIKPEVHILQSNSTGEIYGVYKTIEDAETAHKKTRNAYILTMRVRRNAKTIFDIDVR